jgi:hypothetical protein
MGFLEPLSDLNIPNYIFLSNIYQQRFTTICSRLYIFLICCNFLIYSVACRPIAR